MRARDAWLTAAAVWAAYALSLAPGLSFYDSAELALVAAQGGLGHPVGQPLHTALGWLVTRILPSTWGLTLMLSALPVALMAPPLTALARRMAPHTAPRWLVPVFIGAALLHPIFWESGARVEVYALSTSLAVWAAAWMAEALSSRRGWLWAGVLLGLSAATNPYTAMITAAAAGPALLWAVWRRRLGPREIAQAIGGGLIGLLPYGWIALVAHRPDAFVWGAPVDSERLWFYLRGADYQRNRTITGPMWAAHLEDLARWCATVGRAPLLGLGLVGNLWLGRALGLGRAFGGLSLGLAALLLTSNAIFDMRIADYPAYLALPTALLTACAAALGAHGWARSRLTGVLLALVIAAAWMSPPSVFGRRRGHDDLARVMARGALDDAPEGAVLVVESDHWLWPLLHTQQVEGRRGDVVVLPVGLASSSWYWAWLYRLHPALSSFALRGPGGRDARVRRFLAAQGRPTIFEDLPTAARLGRPTCVRRWLIGGAKACPAPSGTPAALDAVAQALGDGAPTSSAVLARIGWDRGEALWRMGHGAEALRALWVSVPPSLRPPAPPAQVTVEPWREPPMSFAGAPPIGNPGQNLFLGARLLYLAGRSEGAAAWMRAAARAGLKEATQ